MNKLAYEIYLTPTFNFFFFKTSFVYFFPVLGLHCCEDFSLAGMSRGYPLLQCTDFPLGWLLSLRPTVSPAFGLRKLQLPAAEHRLGGCGSRAQQYGGPSWVRGQTHGPCMGRRILYCGTTKEALAVSLVCFNL